MRKATIAASRAAMRMVAVVPVRIGLLDSLVLPEEVPYNIFRGNAIKLLKLEGNWQRGIEWGTTSRQLYFTDHSM